MSKRRSSTPQIALIYVRVSTARQATEGVSLEAQEAKCRAHAERQGWHIAEVFADEGISGKDGVEDRPGLKALIERAQVTPGAVVVVYSVSRLARRQKLLWSMLDDRDGLGLAVSSASEPFDTTTPTGRAMLGMIAVFSQLEADMVSERTKDALAALKAQGMRLGRRSMAESHPELVKMVRDLSTETGLDSRRLAEELNRRGVPTATGNGKWHKTTVLTALSASRAAT